MGHHERTWAGSCWLAAAGVLLTVGAARSDELDDQLAKVNEEFRKQYAASRAEALAKAGPVIVVEGDKLVLLRGDKRFVADLVVSQYGRLKMIAHVPVAAYLFVTRQPPGWKRPQNPGQGQPYTDLKHTLTQTLRLLDTSEGLPRNRQLQIVQASLEFLEKAEPSDDDAIRNFGRKVRPLIEANMADAARMQIDAIHAQVTAWKKLNPGDWQILRVVVMGSQMPRKNNLAVQYFAKLLKEPGEGKRIIYAEALFDEQKAVNLLGTHLLDAQLGAVFFGDPERMHRDLLADAATEYLKKMKWE